MNKYPDIFDSEGRKAYQAATWKRTDIPVEVITQDRRWIGYKDLANAQVDFPHLTLGQGMRGRWRDVCEFVLRFEEYVW